MVFSSDAYEKAFPRKQVDSVKSTSSEPLKQGDVLEEAEKVNDPKSESSDITDHGDAEKVNDPKSESSDITDHGDAEKVGDQVGD